VAGVEAAWANGPLRAAPEIALDQFLDVASIDQSGNVVTVQFAFTDGRDTARALDLLFCGEAQFAHI
jgi:hypothetical protein